MRIFTFTLCVFTLVVLAHGLTDEEKGRLRQIHSECQSDPATHVDEDVLQRAYKGENVGSQVGAHVLCMSKKIGFQKENGDIDKAVIRRRLSKVITDDEAKLNEVANTCSVQKATAEATAGNIFKCFHDHAGHVLHVHHQH